MHPLWTGQLAVTNDAANEGSPLLIGILKSATAMLGVVRFRPNWTTRNEMFVADVQFMRRYPEYRKHWQDQSNGIAVIPVVQYMGWSSAKT